MAETKKQKKAGRPLLKNIPTLIRLPAEDMRKISELSGSYGMSKFIREAVSAEIKRREAAR